MNEQIGDWKIMPFRTITALIAFALGGLLLHYPAYGSSTELDNRAVELVRNSAHSLRGAIRTAEKATGGRTFDAYSYLEDDHLIYAVMVGTRARVIKVFVDPDNAKILFTRDLGSLSAFVDDELSSGIELSSMKRSLIEATKAAELHLNGKAMHIEYKPDKAKFLVLVAIAKNEVKQVAVDAVTGKVDGGRVDGGRPALTLNKAHKSGGAPDAAVADAVAGKPEHVAVVASHSADPKIPPVAVVDKSAPVSLREAILSAEKATGGRAFGASGKADAGQMTYSVKINAGVEVLELSISSADARVLGTVHKGPIVSFIKGDSEKPINLFGMGQSLIKVTEAAETETKGKAISADYKAEKNGKAVFIVSIMRPTSKVKEVRIDAATGKILPAGVAKLPVEANAARSPAMN